MRRKSKHKESSKSKTPYGTKFEDLDDLIALECGGGCGLNFLWSRGYTTEFVEEAVEAGYFRWISYTNDPEQEKLNGKIDVVCRPNRGE